MFAMTADRIRTIQRASRALLVFFSFVTIISLWSTLASVAHANPTVSRTLAGIVFEGEAITDRIQGVWLMQMLLSAALSLKLIYHFVRLMVLYARGEIFTAQSVSQIRQVGVTFACAILIWLAVLAGVWPEIFAAQDQWTNIMPSFPAGAIMGAILFLFASQIMDEGRKLREEQDLVV